MLIAICDRCGKSFEAPSWYGTGSHTVMITILDQSGQPQTFNFDTDPECTAGAEGITLEIFPFSTAAKAALAAAAAQTALIGTGTTDGNGTTDGSGSGA